MTESPFWLLLALLPTSSALLMQQEELSSAPLGSQGQKEHKEPNGNLAQLLPTLLPPCGQGGWLLSFFLPIWCREKGEPCCNPPLQLPVWVTWGGKHRWSQRHGRTDGRMGAGSEPKVELMGGWHGTGQMLGLGGRQDQCGIDLLEELDWYGGWKANVRDDSSCSPKDKPRRINQSLPLLGWQMHTEKTLHNKPQSNSFLRTFMTWGSLTLMAEVTEVIEDPFLPACFHSPRVLMSFVRFNTEPQITTMLDFCY